MKATYTVVAYRPDHINQGPDRQVQLAGGFPTRQAAENSRAYRDAVRAGQDVYARPTK